MVPEGWRGRRAQLQPAKSGERGEVGTYLGNLCFSFLRLCLVGGTDTRHWAISSYWALVSIMLGQSLGGGGTSKKNTLGSSSLGAGGTRGGHTGARRRAPHFPGGAPPALHPPRNSLGFTRSVLPAGAGFRPVCPARTFWAAAVGPAEGNAAMSVKGKPIRKQRPRRRRSLSLREQVSRQRPPGIHLGRSERSPRGLPASVPAHSPGSPGTWGLRSLSLSPRSRCRGARFEYASRSAGFKAPRIGDGQRKGAFPGSPRSEGGTQGRAPASPQTRRPPSCCSSRGGSTCWETNQKTNPTSSLSPRGRRHPHPARSGAGGLNPLLLAWSPQPVGHSRRCTTWGERVKAGPLSAGPRGDLRPPEALS